METTTDRSALEGKLIPELQRIAQEMGIEGTQKLRKAGLIDAIVAKGGNGGRGRRERPPLRGATRRSSNGETATPEAPARRGPVATRPPGCPRRRRPIASERDRRRPEARTRAARPIVATAGRGPPA